MFGITCLDLGDGTFILPYGEFGAHGGVVGHVLVHTSSSRQRGC